MKKISILILSMAALGGIASAQAADPYKVTFPAGAQNNGKTFFLTNADTKQKMDSTIVENGVAVIKGTVDEPYLAYTALGDKGLGQCIVECGSIVLSEDGRKASGSPLNDTFNDYITSMEAIAAQYDDNAPEEARKAVIDRYNQYNDSTLEANLDNPIGYRIMRDLAFSMPYGRLKELVDKSPTLQSSQYISIALDMAAKRESTSVGKKYTDFEVNGEKLRDYVGCDGKYLLVDFWASWCGPCRREIPGIKQLLADNADKLNVLGVAVWDNPEDTRGAIERLGITWPVILDAQSIPTEIYGIMGIPCIILISPDGTIVVRDKQGAELKDAVEAALK